MPQSWINPATAKQPLHELQQLHMGWCWECPLQALVCTWVVGESVSDGPWDYALQVRVQSQFSEAHDEEWDQLSQMWGAELKEGSSSLMSRQQSLLCRGHGVCYPRVGKWQGQISGGGRE